MQAFPASRVGLPKIRCLLIVVLVLMPAHEASAAGAAKPLFPDPFFQTGPSPDKVAATDFNGDGAIDLVTTSFAAGGISILISTGGGSFEPGPSPPTAGALASVAAADLNGDGKVDLAVGEYANAIAIYFGDGTGNFAFQTITTVGDSPEFIAVADLNLDGAPDLAVASPTSDLSVLLGRGDGTFLPASTFGTGAGNYAIAVVDFNLDGFPDLALTTSFEDHEGVLLLGHGDGQFDAAQPIGAATGGFFIVSADFDRDGHPDLAISDYFATQVSVLLGDGAGGVRSMSEIGLLTNDQWLGTADFNDDGIADLALPDTVLLGEGDGTFVHRIPSVALANGNAIADLDGDGSPDMASADGQEGVNILLNDGRGLLGPPVYPTSNAATIVASGDFNEDGLADLVGASTFAHSLTLRLGDTDGSFGPESVLPAEALVLAVASGDFDGDGRTDLAYSAQIRSHSLLVLRGRGDGTFQEAVRTILGVDPVSLTLGDFNGDGRADLAAISSSVPYLQVLLGKADGTFEMVGQAGPPLRAIAAAAADFDADGHQDLAVAYPDVRSVTILKGHGDGGFETGGSFGAGDYLSSVLAADLNEDGLLDLVAGHTRGFEIPGGTSAAYKISVLPGAGDGTFGEETRYPVGFLSFEVGAADFDQDGHVDLLAGGSAILFGAGDGTFGNMRRFAHWGRSVIEDFNGDGWPDVAVAHYSMIVALNQGAGPGGSLEAHAGADTDFECATPEGAEVLLDGSASIGDITTFEWFEDYGQPEQILLGEGETLHVTLPLGVHLITLRLTAPGGSQATDDVSISVVDTAGPMASVDLTPSRIWPPNNKMVDVVARVSTADACAGTIVVKLTSIQEEGFAGNANLANDVSGAEMGTSDFSYQLRARRPSSKQGGFYRVTYTATDASGNQTTSSGLVLIPHDQRSTRAHGSAQNPKP